MRRLVSIFALACILAQTSLPFFVAKEAKAAELDNIVETNIKLDANKFPKNSSSAGLFEKLGEFDFLPAEILDSGSFPGIQFFDGGIYPMNSNASVNTAGHGILVNGKKGYTSFGGVVDFYFKISSQTGQTAETNDLKNLLFMLILSKTKEEIPLHNIKNNSSAGFSAIYNAVPQGGTPESIGFTQEYVPEKVTGKINYEVPGAGSPQTVTGATAYNISSFIQKKANSTNTGFGFSVPIKGLEPSTQYYAQILVTKTTSGNPWTAYSKVLEFPTLAKNADGTDNYGNYDPGKDISEQTDTISEYTDDEAAEEVSAEIIGELLSCSWRKPLTWFKGCMVIAFHDLIYTASAKVLEIGAKLMDIFIGFSISSFFYSDNIGVILEGWRIVRDVSNILFIFILLWTAFNIILRVNHHFNANRVITQLIIIGLLINFSLFFTRVVIDAGNIAARVFYNAITVTPGTDDLNEIQMITGEKEKKPAIKSLSGAITKGLGVTQMIDSDATKRALEGRNGLVFLVLILGTVMNIVAAWTFFQCAFFFVGRIISLWAAMIFAPFAFTSTILPQLSQVPKIGWGVWLKNLLSAAFGAAFFMFFLFLIIKFCNSPILSDITNNLQNGKLSTGTLFALILLQFLFIIGLIKAAKSIASIMAGEFGGALAAGLEGATKFLGGAAVGLGAGALAFGGSRLLGGRASSWLNSAEGNMHKQASTGSQSGLNALRNSNLAKYGNMTDQQLRDLAQKKVEGKQKMASRSFDIRNTGAANLITKGTGIDFNAAAALGKLTGIGMLKATDIDITSGGFQASIDRKAQKQKTYLDSLHLNDEEKKKLEEELKEKEEELKEAKKPHEGQIESNERLAKQLLERIQARGDKATAAEEAQLKAYQDLTNAAKDSLSKNHVNADPTIKALASRIEEIKKGTVNPATGAREGGLEQVGKSAMRMYQDFLTRNHMAHQREGYLGRAGGEWRNNRNIFYQRSLGRAFLQLGKNIPNAIVDAFKTGIVGSAVFGPGTGLGLAIGKSVDQALFGGGFLKAFKSFTTDELGGARRVEQQALHALEAGHVHEPHAKVIYKSPNQGIFDMFKSSSGGGGGGAKKDSHGHGGGHH